MVCCACGVRQLPRFEYCHQCDCPLGALVPPPGIERRRLRPQRLPVPHTGRDSERLALLGLLCAGVGWLPLSLGLCGCALAVLFGSVALRRARASHRHGALRLSWAAILIGSVCAVPALAAF